MFFRSKLEEIYESKARDFVRSNYEKITVLPGDLNYNYKCHLNAVHYAKDGKSVVTCYAIENTGKVISHFINFDKGTGEYIDNTWGWTQKFYYYYLVKEIKESEYDYPTYNLEILKKNIFQKVYTNKFINWIYNFTFVDQF